MANFTLQTRFDLRTVEHASALLATVGELNQLLRSAGLPPGSTAATAASLGLLDAVSRAMTDSSSPLRVPAARLEPDDDLLVITVDDVVNCFPWSLEKLPFFLFLAVFGHDRWLGAKYRLPGVVEVEPGDVVIDCGSFAGGYALAARRAGAGHVHAVEPSRRNARALARNCADDAITLHPIGLGPTRGHARFTESSTGVDSSFGTLDEGAAVATYDVDVQRLSDLLESLTEPPDVLKLEAEGLELGILRSLGTARIPRIAIDGSPENQSDDRRPMIAWLELAGYDVYMDANMLYAVHREDVS